MFSITLEIGAHQTNSGVASLTHRTWSCGPSTDAPTPSRVPRIGSGGRRESRGRPACKY